LLWKSNAQFSVYRRIGSFKKDKKEIAFVHQRHRRPHASNSLFVAHIIPLLLKYVPNAFKMLISIPTHSPRIHLYVVGMRMKWMRRNNCPRVPLISKATSTSNLC
uniref:Uncharacterized protein n=1 Tax=Parascaris univalens TaxID=6257 RepID=A0A915CDG1_PARUN